MVCLTLAIVATPATQLAVWADRTLLSTQRIRRSAHGPAPRPGRASQITAQIDRQLQRAGRAQGPLASPLADLAGRAVARAVPAIVGSPTFLHLWRTALAATHHQLLLVLRDRSQLLTITGSALTVDVPVAAGMLINAVGLPHRLERLLPAAIPVSVTILASPALGQARTAVHLTDILSRILPAAALALALAGDGACRLCRALITCCVNNALRYHKMCAAILPGQGHRGRLAPEAVAEASSAVTAGCLAEAGDAGCC